MSGRKILIIDDDELLVGAIQRKFETAGFQVITATRGGQGRERVKSDSPDLVILDLALPDDDGTDICRDVRAFSRVPIIMLTGRAEETDRIVGLELGADDYVTKPFSPRELVARMRAVRRRYRPAPRHQPLAFGDVAVDPQARTVAVAGEPVALTVREFDLLYCLLDNAGVVLTREQLLERVWGLDFPLGTRTVDQHVAQVRGKLGQPDLIETVRGVGYKAVRS